MTGGRIAGGLIPTGVDDDSPAVPSRHGLRRQAIHDFLVAERKTWMPTCVGMTVCGGPACQPFRGLVLYYASPRDGLRSAVAGLADGAADDPDDCALQLMHGYAQGTGI